MTTPVTVAKTLFTQALVAHGERVFKEHYERAYNEEWQRLKSAHFGLDLNIASGMARDYATKQAQIYMVADMITHAVTFTKMGA